MSAPRAKTIAANGEIVPKPYGPGRWRSPRRYRCAHGDCNKAASILVRANVHDVAGSAKAHNCCGAHDREATLADQDN